MEIFLDLIRFLEASIAVSAALFCFFIYIRTRDSLIGRMAAVISPISMLMLISFAYTYISNYIETYYQNVSIAVLGNVASLLNIVTVFMISMTIAASIYFFFTLINLKQYHLKTVFMVMVPAIALFTIVGVFFVSVVSKDYFSESANRTTWMLYAIVSLIPFVEALVTLIKIKDCFEMKSQKMLCKFFVISFLPQIIYTMLDLFTFKSVRFQFTNISYLVFAILSFYYVSSKYFHAYDKETVQNEDVIDNDKLMVDYSLSNREMDFIPLLLEGKSNEEIAHTLYISINTVKTHIKNIYKKLEVSNRLQLIHLLTYHPKE